MLFHRIFLLCPWGIKKKVNYFIFQRRNCCFEVKTFPSYTDSKWEGRHEHIFFWLQHQDSPFSPTQASQGGGFKCISGMEGERKAVVLEGHKVRHVGSMFLSCLGVRSGPWRSQNLFPRDWRVYSMLQIWAQCCACVEVRRARTGGRMWDSCGVSG